MTCANRALFYQHILYETKHDNYACFTKNNEYLCFRYGILIR